MNRTLRVRVRQDELIAIDRGDLFRVVRTEAGAAGGTVELEPLPPERPAHVVVGERAGQLRTISLSVGDCARVESALRFVADEQLSGECDDRDRAVAGYYRGLAAEIGSQRIGAAPAAVKSWSIKRPDGSWWTSPPTPLDENGEIVGSQ